MLGIANKCIFLHLDEVSSQYFIEKVLPCLYMLIYKKSFSKIPGDLRLTLRSQVLDISYAESVHKSVLWKFLFACFFVFFFFTTSKSYCILTFAFK